MNLKVISKFLFVLVLIGLLFSWRKYLPLLFAKKQQSVAAKIQDCRIKYEELKKATVDKPLVLPEEKKAEEASLNDYEYDFSRMIFLFEQINSIIKNQSFDPQKKIEKDYLIWLLEEIQQEYDLFSDYLASQRSNRLEKSKVRSRRSLFYYRRALINSLTKIKSLIAQKPKIRFQK